MVQEIIQKVLIIPKNKETLVVLLHSRKIFVQHHLKILDFQGTKFNPKLFQKKV